MNKLPIAVVVIPTYNEAGSIGKMLDHLFTETFPGIKDWSCKVLVVDDTSPDGTYKVVQAKQKKYANLYLSLSAKKSGIGGAYVRGFRYAMKELGADVVIEFDGDFQHPPKTIPLLLNEIADGYDYVLGSRKIKGGSNPKGWGFKRLFFSEVGGLVARFVLFFPTKNFFRITDPTTGLKASRVKEFVDTMDMDHLYSRSFGYKLEFLYKMVQLGAKIKEVPLRFYARTAGESKIEPQTAKDIFRTVFLLRWFDPTTQKFLKFGIIGLFGFVINKVGLDTFAKLLSNLISVVGIRNTVANALAAEVSIISNFILNNLWTFKNEKLVWGTKLVRKFTTFNLSSVVSGIILPSLVIGLGTQIFGDQYRFLFLIIGVFFITVPLNWFIYNLVIWKKR
ncbi:TPA: glycosyltransferase family 2 protein [Candidatus Collierbacteria bacterium]|uniref:Dolichyl-phosphate beta-D-mannosyltransferase n=1 Tax=Candidatus Collierbacteria bacterium GW2011_GWB2_44_22 TaxID=1618387 RepID=A0A0G1K797_9BACT|nr:MAG: Dolichyl-phosphate beta-D-mannosyltransferase [Candidatus Collierbacteria bacterium GW2011_GWA2_44_13]KKT52177.1 MAG: Dolichyl-phosphate beta-D-mannosyltransferase [Candidatus Collierbacteria bacterium GW2011_GWB2_44_22]KKT62341.1 MAG: Dolichyl-phosphate beta-D-mannosyltransferase [Candidatus Collierbacteria bacterium GW2011_GWD1_44_27]KKT65890.1 MAG: Dolichyl-phosphate beta-D-mannosyltransferase [Candidatus Collierbacteria bacterium GW2011_GWC2_44_30]KKT68631.1 MAG: Dolichyl-phosphate 